MISPDDPRLTAYVSGDLSPEEAARLETELARDPAARAELDAISGNKKAATRAVQFAPEAEAVVVRPARNARRWLGPLIAAACVVVAGAVIIPTVGTLRGSTTKSRDGTNLRQIGQATMIYAFDHAGRLPNASDVWDFARMLAHGGGLNDASIWTSQADIAGQVMHGRLSTVLTADRIVVDSVFRQLKPSWAVVLGQMQMDYPGATPLAWTRGLQPDGTWAEHAPYGSDGGYVMSLDGQVRFYRQLTNRDGLPRFGGGKTTVNILEAIPPGARVGEYVPTAEERAAWTEIARARKARYAAQSLGWRDVWDFAGFLVVLLIILCGLSVFIMYGIDRARARFGRLRR